MPTSSENNVKQAKPIAKYAEYLLYSVGVIANLGGILQLFGFVGDPRHGTLIILGGITILVSTGLARYFLLQSAQIRELQMRLGKQSNQDITLVTWSALNLNNVSLQSTDIFILASGTETYYHILAILLSETKQRGFTLHIGFRLGDDQNRFHKLLDFAPKWTMLADQYSLKLKYYYCEDYTMFFRGIVFGDSMGYIGFYHRIGGRTYGLESQVIRVTKESEIGKYLIDNFLKCYKLMIPIENIETVVKQRVVVK